MEEEFHAPERSFTDRLPGGDARYEEKMKQARDKYFREGLNDYLAELKGCKTMEDLFLLSLHMVAYGYQFPIAGQIRGEVANISSNDTHLFKDIYFLSADREYEVPVTDFAKIEKEDIENINQDDLFNYLCSWQWWTANILRCLYFWNEPFGKEADQKIREIREENPIECPLYQKYVQRYGK